MSERTNWKSVPRPDAGRVRDVVEDEARITAFRELVYQLRVDAGLTQVELARRMGTTQSAIARMENGGTRPTLPWNASLAPLIRNLRSWSARG